MMENICLYTHTSIRISGESGIVYIDPFQMKEEPKDADYILITHDHHDHFSPEDIAKVSKGDSVLVMPEKMGNICIVDGAGIGKFVLVKPGEAYDIGGLKIETVPAYNKLKPFHPKSNKWVGYIVIMNGKRIYITGDTDVTKEAKQVKCDIAMVPVGGTYTMDAGKAAELVNTIRPEIAIPTHYGSIVGKEEDASIFAGKVDKAIRVEIIKKY
jgi:L-ascorbate metabolism protein UlaG (beta-lactamase superfamily)